MRANVYIRKENEAAWLSSGKSDWINDALADRSFLNKYATDTTPRPRESYVIGLAPDDSKIIPMTLTPVIGMDEALRRKQKDRNLDFCSHDAVKGFCKKGCK